LWLSRGAYGAAGVPCVVADFELGVEEQWVRTAHDRGHLVAALDEELAGRRMRVDAVRQAARAAQVADAVGA